MTCTTVAALISILF